MSENTVLMVGVSLTLASKVVKSFRRAGITVTTEGLETKVTEAQLEALEKEPMIKVELLTAETQNEKTNSEGGDQPISAADLVDEIIQLDPENDKLWMKDGRPQTKALSAAVGQDISAALRDEAWELYQERLAAAEGTDETDAAGTEADTGDE